MKREIYDADHESLRAPGSWSSAWARRAGSPYTVADSLSRVAPASSISTTFGAGHRNLGSSEEARTSVFPD